MTTLLVPSDFTPASLKLAEQAVKVLNREVNIILFHAFDLPFYHSDLIRPESHPWQQLMNDELRNACRQLKDRYPWLVRGISCKFMQGNSAALFRNWAEANEIDIIACPNSYVHTKVHERSLDPIPLFKRSRVVLLKDFTVSRTVAERVRNIKKTELSVVEA